MPLLAEYSITPDVFDETSYSSGLECSARLDIIREVMMNEGLVRNLRNGEWRRQFSDPGRPWHRRAKEILRKLHTQGRLIEFATSLSLVPTDDLGWCAEALASHQTRTMNGGVIVTKSVKDAYRRESLVARVDRLNSASWWTQRSPSVQLDRKIAAYREQLVPILRCANSLQFIDPYLNPEEPGYREFAKLLGDAGKRDPAPLIEIHRVCFEGGGVSRTFPDFRSIFRRALTEPLRAAALSARVFVWDEFHDRFLLSNLVGLSLPYGLATSTRPRDMTTWTRMGHDDRDNIQREFEEATRRHTLHDQFTLP